MSNPNRTRAIKYRTQLIAEAVKNVDGILPSSLQTTDDIKGQVRQHLERNPLFKLGLEEEDRIEWTNEAYEMALKCCPKLSLTIKSVNQRNAGITSLTEKLLSNYLQDEFDDTAAIESFKQQQQDATDKEVLKWIERAIAAARSAFWKHMENQTDYVPAPVDWQQQRLHKIQDTVSKQIEHAIETGKLSTNVEQVLDGIMNQQAKLVAPFHRELIKMAVVNGIANGKYFQSRNNNGSSVSSEGETWN